MTKESIPEMFDEKCGVDDVCHGIKVMRRVNQPGKGSVKR